jgi:hypothetical protein
VGVATARQVVVGRANTRKQTVKQLIEQTAAGMRYCKDFLVTARSNLSMELSSQRRRKDKVSGRDVHDDQNRR